MTKLGNATLFGNVASFVFAGWGLWLARRWPSPLQATALGLAAVGAALLMGSSFELGPRATSPGDLLALFAGLLYTGYLIAVQRARRGSSRCRCCSSPALSGAAMLLPDRSALANESSRTTGRRC